MKTHIDKRYLRIVNRENPLDKHKPDYYNYEDVLIKIDNNDVIDSDEVIEKGDKSSIVRTFIEEETLSAFNALKDNLSRKGFNIRINEAGRTEEKQDFYRKRAEAKGLEYAENYVAKPKESEHGQGTAIDIGIYSKAVSKIKNPKINNAIHKVVRKLILYPVMHRTAVRYGFITRYPVRYGLTSQRRKEIQDMLDDTLDFDALPMDADGTVLEPKNRKVTMKSSGKEFRKLKVQYNYEPWHETYVGKFNAQFMNANGLTLEEYVKLVDAYEEYAKEFEDEAECLPLQLFYNLYSMGNEWDERYL